MSYKGSLKIKEINAVKAVKDAAAMYTPTPPDAKTGFRHSQLGCRSADITSASGKNNNACNSIDRQSGG